MQLSLVLPTGTAERVVLRRRERQQLMPHGPADQGWRAPLPIPSEPVFERQPREGGARTRPTSPQARPWFTQKAATIETAWPQLLGRAYGAVVQTSGAYA